MYPNFVVQAFHSKQTCLFLQAASHILYKRKLEILLNLTLNHQSKAVMQIVSVDAELLSY